MTKQNALNIDVTPGGGLSYTMPSAAGQLALSYPYGFGVTGSSTTQSIPSGTATTVQFDTKAWDFSSEFNTGTYTYTPTTAGYYQVNAVVYFQSPLSGSFNQVGIVVNGSFIVSSSGVPGGSNDFQQCVSGIVHLNVSDALVIKAYQNSGSSKVVYGPNSNFNCQRLF